MMNHAIVNKPLYFVTSLCAVDVCFYKLIGNLVQCRYTGEFFLSEIGKIAQIFSGLL